MLFLAATVVSGAAPSKDQAARLYVTNSLGDDITVIDLRTFKVVGDIKVGEQVHGLCAPADGRRLFTTIESEDKLKVIDTATGGGFDHNALTAGANTWRAPPE